MPKKRSLTYQLRHILFSRRFSSHILRKSLSSSRNSHIYFRTFAEHTTLRVYIPLNKSNSITVERYAWRIFYHSHQPLVSVMFLPRNFSQLGFKLQVNCKYGSRFSINSIFFEIQTAKVDLLMAQVKTLAEFVVETDKRFAVEVIDVT